MARHAIGRMVVCGSFLFALAACEGGALDFSFLDTGDDDPAAVAATADEAEPLTAGETTDSIPGIQDGEIEAPEVFEETAAALWDGRPSFGGVWVAHTDATDPERVIIRNESNGKIVIGALFRRERDNPGPEFQVSADAAAALGMIAGQPTTLRVTALRQSETESEAEAETD